MVLRQGAGPRFELSEELNFHPYWLRCFSITRSEHGCWPRSICVSKHVLNQYLMITSNNSWLSHCEGWDKHDTRGRLGLARATRLGRSRCLIYMKGNHILCSNWKWKQNSNFMGKGERKWHLRRQHPREDGRLGGEWGGWFCRWGCCGGGCTARNELCCCFIPSCPLNRTSNVHYWCS